VGILELGLINVFRPTREEVTGEKRELHNGEFSDLGNLVSTIS
jgi:hypothetical protein